MTKINNCFKNDQCRKVITYLALIIVVNSVEDTNNPIVALFKMFLHVSIGLSAHSQNCDLDSTNNSIRFLLFIASKCSSGMNINGE